MSEKITSVQDLLKIREKACSAVELRSGQRETLAVVHMGTCGIAAGARDVLAALVDELDRRKVQTVTVRQSGCIGLCDQEPMLTYTDKEGRNFLYVHLDAAKVKEIVGSHLIGGQPCTRYIMEGEGK
jgi:(2Fe-2S) ferredoxin